LTNVHGQTLIYKALLRKLKIEQHEPTLEVNTCAPKVYEVPAPSMTAVVLLLLQAQLASFVRR